MSTNYQIPLQINGPIQALFILLFGQTEQTSGPDFPLPNLQNGVILPVETDLMWQVP